MSYNCCNYCFLIYCLSHFCITVFHWFSFIVIGRLSTRSTHHLQVLTLSCPVTCSVLWLYEQFHPSRHLQSCWEDVTWFTPLLFLIHPYVLVFSTSLCFWVTFTKLLSSSWLPFYFHLSKYYPSVFSSNYPCHVHLYEGSKTFLQLLVFSPVHFTQGRLFLYLWTCF